MTHQLHVHHGARRKTGIHVPVTSVGLGKAGGTGPLAADGSAHASSKIMLYLQSFGSYKITVPLGRMKSLADVSHQKICNQNGFIYWTQNLNCVLYNWEMLQWVFSVSLETEVSQRRQSLCSQVPFLAATQPLPGTTTKPEAPKGFKGKK